LAQLHHVDDRAQRAPDQPLDLLRPTADAAARRLALHARVRRPWQHAVLRRDPPAARVAQETRHAVFVAHRAQDLRVAELDQCRALGVAQVIRGNRHRPQVIGPAAIASFHRAPRDDYSIRPQSHRRPRGYNTAMDVDRPNVRILRALDPARAPVASLLASSAAATILYGVVFTRRVLL